MKRTVKKKVEAGRSQGERRLLACRTCLRDTNHVVLSSIRDDWEHEDNYGYEQHELVQCLGCDTVGCRIESWMDDDVSPLSDGTWVRTPHEQLYPKSLADSRPMADRHLLPPLVRALYDQVYVALREDLDVLVTIGVRALVERTCIEVGATGWGFENKLTKMLTLGKLTDEDVESLDPIRLLGNDAAHEVVAPVRPDLLKCLGVVEHLLERVFVIPARSRHLSKVVQKSRKSRKPVD